MKRSLLLAAAFTLVSLSASAQGLLNQGQSMLQQKAMQSVGLPAAPSTTGALGGLAGGGSLPTGSLSMDGIKQKLMEQGYSKISSLMPSPSGDALLATAVNAAGTPSNLQINPLTGAGLSAVAAH